jgi:hypothetical protein
MQDEIFRLVNGATLVGGGVNGAEAIAEAIKIHCHRQEIRVPLLDRGCKGEYYFGVGGNIFWVGRKITNF